MSLFKLFQTTRPSTVDDGLTQPQREAIVDLLHYCLYADGHVAHAEGRVIDSFVTTLEWAPNVGFSNYEAHSVANARRAREDATYRTEFLRSLRERLDSAKARQTALKVAEELLASDGKTTPAESTLLVEVRRLLDHA